MADKPKQTRTKTFGRTYDHAAGSLTVEVLGKPEDKVVIEATGVPQGTLLGFALQSMGDYIVGSGNEVIREGGTVAEAQKAIADAIREVTEGKVEFTHGTGLGMSSAPATRLVARALIEEGKKFVKWNGKQYDFEGDVTAAQEAMRTLYFDTSEVTLPNGKTMTGRQFFRQLSEVPAIADRLASYRKAKPVSDVVEQGLG